MGQMMMCGFTAAVAAGRTGREGLALGMLFAVLAAATVSRIGAIVAGLPKRSEFADMFTHAPAALWIAGAVVMGVLAWRSQRETTTAKTPSAI